MDNKEHQQIELLIAQLTNELINNHSIDSAAAASAYIRAATRLAGENGVTSKFFAAGCESAYNAVVTCETGVN